MTSSWVGFESDVKQQFTNVNEQQRARDRLADLRQSGSVRDYITQFRNVSLQILDMSAADQLDRFKRGLKDNVRIEVERDCSTLEECERIAERRACSCSMWCCICYIRCSMASMAKKEVVCL
jgi:hypothetical protein